MRTGIALLSIGLALMLPAAAGASLASEQHQGQNLIAQLQAGTRSCRKLSATDLDHIGEYLMFKALGSTALHRAMNDRMIAMLGERGESRMHQLLGARYAGCPTGGYAGMMSAGAMMGGYDTNGGFSAMTNSDNLKWMTGAWQNMTLQGWQRLQRRLLDTSTTGHEGWGIAAIAATILGALVLIALAIVAMIRRPFRHPPTAKPSP